MRGRERESERGEERERLVEVRERDIKAEIKGEKSRSVSKVRMILGTEVGK